MVSRSPKSAYGKQEIAVGLKINANFSRTLVCQRRSQRGRQTVAKAASLVLSKNLIEFLAAKEIEFLALRGPIGKNPVLVSDGAVLSRPGISDIAWLALRLSILPSVEESAAPFTFFTLSGWRPLAGLVRMARSLK